MEVASRILSQKYRYAFNFSVITLSIPTFDIDLYGSTQVS
jgi:hypothetical protein